MLSTILIIILIALSWISVLPYAFSQYTWDLESVAKHGTTTKTNGTTTTTTTIHLTNRDAAYTYYNPNHLKKVFAGNPSEFGCKNDIDSKDEYKHTPNKKAAAALERQEEERLLLTYTDMKNNTVKIYCQWNGWLGDERLRQYTAFYNDKILVGLCPYDSAVNRHEIHTNKEGEIIRTHWLSIRANGTDYVTYNNYFG